MRLLLVIVFCNFSFSAIAQPARFANFGSAPIRENYHRTDQPDSLPADEGRFGVEALSWDVTMGKAANKVDGATIYCFAQDGDYLYVGGDFTEFDTITNAHDIVRYNRKTHLWTTLGGGPNNVVRAIAVHSGKVYVGGSFSSVTNGTTRTTVNDIAVWDGTTWSGVGGGMDNSVYALAFVGDSLFAGGYFSKAGSVSAGYLACWDGNQWFEPNGGTSYPVLALLAAHDSLFVGGDFGRVGVSNSLNQVANGLALLQDDAWEVFGNGPNYVQSMAIFEGKLWTTSSYYDGDNTLCYNFAVWDGNTWNAVGHDSLVGAASTGDVEQIVVVGDSLLVLGGFTSFAGIDVDGIAVYHSGKWSAGPSGIYGYPTAAVLFDGKLFVGGRFTSVGSVQTNAFAAYENGNWSAIATGNGASAGWVSSAVECLATNDKYVAIGGRFTTLGSTACNHVALWDKQEKKWLTLGNGVDGDVNSIAITNSTLYLGGSFNHAGSVAARHIARYDLASQTWSAMGTGAKRFVGAIATDGVSAYAATAQDRPNGVWTDYIERWDGAKWSLAGPGITNGYVNALLFHNGDLYAGGSFGQSVDGATLNGIGQLTSNSWQAFGAGVTAGRYVSSLAFSGSILYIGGDFSAVDHQSSLAIAAWEGSSWSPIGIGFDYYVTALAGAGNGSVYVGGGFTQAGAVSNARSIVKWNAATSNFEAVAGGVDNEVLALADDNSALYIGGWFTAVGSSNSSAYHIASIPGAALSVDRNMHDESAISVYPNPAIIGGGLRLDLGSSSRVTELQLFNAMGDRVWLNNQVSNTAMNIPTAGLTGGVYMLRIVTDRETFSRNIVIQ